MEKELNEKQMRMQLLKPEEMVLIRAGGKKPQDPKSPDEGIMLL
jgi:hypothetical protein